MMQSTAFSRASSLVSPSVSASGTSGKRTSHQPFSWRCRTYRYANAMSVLQIIFREAKLGQHCVEKAGADLLLAVLQGGEPGAVIQPSVTALPATGIE